MKRISVLSLLMIISLSACGPAPDDLAGGSAPETAVAGTSTPASTQTATAIPTSTSTPTPTNTPTITPTFSPETLNFPAGAPLRIGYLLWENNPLGIDSIRGVEIAISDFGGEIFGHPIELTGLNSECHEFAASQGSKILMQDKTILGIIGTSCSRAGLTASPIVSDHNRVMISPSNSIPELTASDSHSAGYFRTYPNDLVQIKAAAQFAYNQLGAQSLAVVRGPSQVERLYMTALCDVITELGGECVLDNVKDPASTYMVPIINSLVEAAPEAVFFIGWDSHVSSALVTAARSNSDLEDIPVFILWNDQNPEFLQLAGDAAIGVYITATSFEIDQESEIYQSLRRSYRQTYGEDPIQTFHSYAYDAASLLLKAIAQAAVPGDDGSLMVDPLAVRDALYGKLEFQGASGLISCTQLGDCAASAYGKVYQFISGDPNSFNPGPADLLSSNPVQVWP